MRRIVCVGLALMLLAGAGCQSFNPVGPLIQVGIMWKNGEAHKYYNTEQAALVAALKAALAELDLPVAEEWTTADGAVHLTAGGKVFVSDDAGPGVLGRKPVRVEFRSADRFHIEVTPVRPRTTLLSIRVNVFGDRPYAELIYRHVDGRPGVVQVTSETPPR
jgi:hypothetical protein